ncbi:hypothetical protein [Flavihumibacter petaseus]|uniref:Uncharacterized protein n=1 Tax=Flavihumibacter petaseus NBRC 106054 TaxID=1220578 RepID=A0A0E9MVZ4_9BACT|nr:hypothetical protein [Flavihumibacter petaseus]GAO41764.1 hypothetical protein FPE01S_01_07780 [Flavihumibacter petaseus NBRC 106054]
MQVFTIKQDGFKEVRKLLLFRAIPFMLIAAIVGIVIGTINTTTAPSDMNIWPVVVPFIILMLGWGMYRGVNRQKELFESYTLKITDNLVTREQLNTPTISIYFADIKEIVKHKNGGYTIRGKDARELIVIPVQIDNYSQLETSLQAIQQISTQHTVSFIQKYQGLTGLLTVGLMLCVYTVNNKIVVALAGTTFVSLMIWSLLEIRSNKNIDNKTKRSMWWILLVLFSVIAVMIMKLTANAEIQSY